MEIIDDFLEQKDFDELQNMVMGTGILWIYLDAIDHKTEKDKFQFIHSFYNNVHLPSPVIKILNPILEIINPVSIWRIKANLLTRTPKIVENKFHVDLKMSEEKQKQWTTSIFYVNTNNGYTEFEDGTKVESVANRIVTFPANMKHRGTSCTDEKTRVVINFNYFSKYFCE
jgi:hypothetical protein